MRNSWRSLVCASLATALAIAVPQQSLGGPDHSPFGIAHRMSPTGEILVSWKFEASSPGSSLEFFRVEDGKVTAEYDAGFPIENVEFSLSGRFICVSGYRLTFDTSGGEERRSRVAVVDTE